MTQSRLDNYIDDQRLQSFEQLEQIVQRRRDKRASQKARKRNKKLDDPSQTTLF